MAKVKCTKGTVIKCCKGAKLTLGKESVKTSSVKLNVADIYMVDKVEGDNVFVSDPEMSVLATAFKAPTSFILKYFRSYDDKELEF